MLKAWSLVQQCSVVWPWGPWGHGDPDLISAAVHAWASDSMVQLGAGPGGRAGPRRRVGGRGQEPSSFRLGCPLL